MKKYDYLIVGAGLAGSVLAERIASRSDKRILLIDRRNHIGGNCFDYYNETGILIHKYGPHCFHTNSKEVFGYLSRFAKWRKFELKTRAFVDGKLYPLVINRNFLNQFFNINLRNKDETRKFLHGIKEKIRNPKNSEEYVISKAGRKIYEKFFKNYTLKQWGLSGKELDPCVCSRIPIRTNNDDRYFSDTYQGMPNDGYFRLFGNMLSHPNIEIKLNADFKTIKNQVKYDSLIYTGSIDEFFNFKFGELPCRSLKFKHENHDKEFYQEATLVTYPNDYSFTRIVEIKHATGQKCANTTVIKEYPQSKGEPFYPIINPKNNELYTRYKKEAKKLRNVIFIGRMAQYKYFNMDQIVEEALAVAKHILKE